MKERGLVHIYCGDGKGKTSAAIGLAIRASGAGLKVCFAQFMKSGDSSEWESIKHIDGIDTKIVRNDFGFTWNMSPEQKVILKNRHNEQLQVLYKMMNQYDVMILDEIISAYNNELLDKECVLDMIKNRNHTEIVLTGRNPEKELQELSDYLTEMKCIKHPYQQGISARKGIEY